jgi:cysteine desulfuration protein SufE
MTSTYIQQNETELIEGFSFFEDELERYEYIMDLGKELDPLDDVFKNEAFEVKGCQSKVWLRAVEEGTVMRFEADSNTQITKGLIAILIKTINGAEKNEIAEYNFGIIDKINLKSHLTSQRSNGLNAMIQKIKAISSGAN